MSYILEYNEMKRNHMTATHPHSIPIPININITVATTYAYASLLPSFSILFSLLSFFPHQLLFLISPSFRPAQLLIHYLILYCTMLLYSILFISFLFCSYTSKIEL